MSLIRKKFMKNITMPTFPYPSSEIGFNNKSQSHDEAWMKFGLSLIQSSLIPRCTYHWEQHPTSTWNTAVTAILLHSWEMCHQRGGTSNYSISEAHNTPANRLAIVHRWLKSRKAIWKAQNQNAPAPNQKAKKPSVELTKKKVFCFALLMIEIPKQTLIMIACISWTFNSTIKRSFRHNK